MLYYYHSNFKLNFAHIAMCIKCFIK